MPRILLIDDDRLQHRVIAEAVRGFRGGPFELEWAATYDAGLTALLGGGHDVCLLDYGLGERDGLELLRTARARGCRTPVIFLTATSDPAVDEAALEAGAADYLVKGEVTPVLLERSIRYTRRIDETLRHLRELASHDQLTGLLNRREFQQSLRDEWERWLRYGTSFGILLIDVDGFKEVNDAHGHAGGDEVLRWVSRLVKSNTRAVDRCFRYGGDEFACLITESGETAGLACARRLVETVAGTPLPVAEDRHVRVTVSVGVAAVSHTMTAPEALVKAADHALYAAKQAGRNRAVGGSTVS